MQFLLFTYLVKSKQELTGSCMLWMCYQYPIHLFVPFTTVKTKSTWSPTILSTSPDCRLCCLLTVRTSSPLCCSLLMHRLSVQRRKACLLRWRVSKKGTQPVHCPSLPHSQSSRQNNRSLSPRSVCPPSHRAPPTRAPRKVQLAAFSFHEYLGKTKTYMNIKVEKYRVET